MLIEDEIEIETDDLKNALSDLLNNGPNDDDKLRAQQHLARLQELLIDLMEEPHNDNETE